MNEEALQLQIRLIAKEAASRESDAEFLASSLSSTSDSAYLLRLLAFELLLKGARLVHGQPARRGHDYARLFSSLPADAQKRIVARARDRMSTSADYSDLPALLELFSRNFISLRYPFERYEGLSVEAYRKRGEAWASSGAPLEGADFVYRPQEVYGLVFALRVELEAWLVARSP